MALQQKIFLLKNLPRKKQFVFAFLFFLILGLMLPTTFAHAQILGALQLLFGSGGPFDIYGGMISALVTFVLQIPVAFANLFISLGALVLGWVISPSFVSVSYTGMDLANRGNPIVAVGWPLARDLANMGFVIALIFIGLGTALRIGEYQAQKTLPILIIMMILVNFTPVLLGLMIDTSNIAMNFFLQGLTGGSTFATVFSAQASIFQNSLKQQFGGTTLNLTLLAQSLVLTMFGFVGGLMLFIFAFLFLIRYVALWMLVIISPIAFFAYAFPPARGIWKIWWNQFLQWCFVGVIAAFFLYLSEQMISKISQFGFNTQGGIVNNTFMDALLPYMAVIIFLAIGFIMAQNVSAMGAREAFSAIKGGKVWLQSRRPVQMGLSRAASATAGGLAAVARAGERLEKTKLGKVPVGVAFKPAAWAMRAPHALATPQLIEYAATQRKFAPPKNWDQMSIPDKERYVNAQGLAEDRLVLEGKMAAEKSLQLSSPTFSAKSLADASKFTGDVKLKKEVSDIMNAFPDKITKEIKIDFELATVPAAEKPAKKAEWEEKINSIVQEFGLVDDAKGKAGDKAAGILHARGFKSGDIEKIAKGSIKSDVFRMATQGMPEANIRKLADSFDRETVEDVLTGPGGLDTVVNNKSDLEEFYLQNPRLVHWFATNPVGKSLNWKGARFAEPDYDNFKKTLDPFLNIRNSKHRYILLQREQLLKQPTLTPDEQTALTRIDNEIKKDPELAESLKQLQASP